MRRRHPEFHKRGEIYYFFRRDEQGKRREESLRTKDINVAIERYNQRRNEIATGRSPNDLSGWTVSAAVSYWLDYRRTRVARGTLSAEKSITRNLQRGLGSGTTLHAVADICRIREYQDQRLKAGISAKTVNNELQVLAGILRLAKLWHRVEAEYRPLRSPKSDVPDALRPHELEEVLRVAAHADANAVVPYAAVLALSTGMRSGEIKGLTLGDLRLEGPYPHIIVRRVTTKTDAGARRVALDTIAVWALKKLVARAFTVGSVRPEDHLLPTDRNRHTRSTDPLHGACGYDPQHPQSSWEREWRIFRRVSGIEHRRFHDLRHTYVSRAAEAGVPIAVVEAQVGHLGMEMVRWYTHVSERGQYRAAQQIEKNSPELLDILGLSPCDSMALTEPAGRLTRDVTALSGQQVRVATARSRWMCSKTVRVSAKQ